MEPSALDGYDAAYVDRAARRLELLRRWFRYELRGSERVPASPVLIVANHSALGVAELLCMLPAMRRSFPDREWRGLMMDMFLKWPGMHAFWRKIGAIPASPANGRAALARGYDVLVFPGGDIDACRPFYEARKVHFGARRGYVRLALEAGVPVVPLATIGSHWTWAMAPGGALLARALLLKRWARIERFPLPLNLLAMGVLLVLVLRGAIPVWLDVIAVVLLLVPPPARITSELLPPIDLVAATAGIVDDAERIEAAHRLVHGALTEAVRTMDHR